MRIVVTLLIVLAALAWLVTWWLLGQPIGTPSVTTAPPVAVGAPVSPPVTRLPAPASGAGVPAPPSTGNTAATRPAAPATPSTWGNATPATPAFPPGVVVDPFADGGPRPVFVDPARPARSPMPNAPETETPLAPPAPPPRPSPRRDSPG